MFVQIQKGLFEPVVVKEAQERETPHRMKRLKDSLWATHRR